VQPSDDPDTQLEGRIRNNGNYQSVPSDLHLIEHAVCHERRGRVQARLAQTGALCVQTEITGRSPQDRYIVASDHYDHLINWNSLNKRLERDAFLRIMDRALSHMRDLADPLFYSDDLWAGADHGSRVPLRVITQYAWHQLFARRMFIRGTPGEGRHGQRWTLINLPRLHPEYGAASDGIIAIDLEERVILIANRLYGGEIWKSVFTALNVLLPLQQVLTMHCGANITHAGTVTLFFGLSGTGKTTLSTDETSLLIGDDGHGWGDDGIFNLTGGCYAKLHDITSEREPLIWDAMRFGAIMENVVLDEHRGPLYEEGPENIRGAYPLEFIPSALPGGRASHPNAIVILTCDMHGVLPPVAVLSPEQAAFHYLAGYTTKVGSTEAESKEAFSPVLSAFLGEPFFPLHPDLYLALFRDRIARHSVPVYLVNTGWTGGPRGASEDEHPEARRFSIATSRAIVHAIQRGEVSDDLQLLPEHGLYVPRHVHGVESRNLNPRMMWKDKHSYDATCRQLAQYIQGTMRTKFTSVPKEILDAGPPLLA
jgi:phosphoenolpyruvate carboxykinase (ATP)